MKIRRWVFIQTQRVAADSTEHKNQAVIKSGPYAHVKNPLYLGTFLIMVGCIVAATNPHNESRYLLLVALPCFLGVFFVYYLPYKFAREGDRLRRRFGGRRADCLLPCTETATPGSGR